MLKGKLRARAPQPHVPQVDALHVRRDARRDGAEVAEGAVELGGAVAGAGPGAGAAGREGGQAGGQEGRQPAGPLPARGPHPAGILRCHPQRRRADRLLRGKQNTRALAALSRPRLSHKQKKEFLT